MKKTDAVSNAVFYFITGPAYTFALSASIINSTVINAPPQNIFLSGALFILLLFLIFLNKKTAAFSAAAFFLCVLLCVLSSVSLGGGLPLKINDGSFLRKMLDYVNGLALFLTGRAPYEKSYALPVTFAVTFISALFAAVNIRLLFNFYFLCAAGFAAVLSPYVFDFTRQDAPAVVFVFCFLVFLIKRQNGFTKREKTRPLFSLALFLPLCAILCAATARLPRFNARPENLRKIRVSAAAQTAGDYIYSMFAPKFFSFSRTGFVKNDGTLGGPVAVNNKFIMEVAANERVYLTGAVKDLYTGYSWETVLTDAASPLAPGADGAFDVSRGLHGVYRSNGEALSPARSKDGVIFIADIIKSTDTVTVSIKNARTSALFLPQNPLSVAVSQENAQVVLSGGGAAEAKNILPANASYSVTYVNNFYGDKSASRVVAFDLVKLTSSRPAAGREHLAAKIADARGALNNLAWDNYGAYFDFMLSFTDITAFDLARNPNLWLAAANVTDVLPSDFLYSGFGYANFAPYLALPESLPERVYNLALDITAPYDTPYEKAEAVAVYLKRFPYTLAPPETPEGADFVDYFLFEAPEGYCTYFASAMAVLLRCAGVPARFMEGYVTPAAPAANGVYTITNAQAHAWVEAFINGVWTAFEPTPPFALPAGGGRVVPNVMFSPVMLEDENPYGQHMDGLGFSPAAPQKITNNTAVSEKNEILEKLRFYLMLFLVILSIAFLCAVCSAAAFARWRINLKKTDRLSSRDAVKVYFMRILKAAALFGCEIARNETPNVFGARLGDRFAFLSGKANILALADIFNKAAYGKADVPAADARLMKACYLEMLERLRIYRFNKYTFFYIVYVLNKA